MSKPFLSKFGSTTSSRAPQNASKAGSPPPTPSTSTSSAITAPSLRPKQHWRTVSTASCATNIPEHLRDILTRYFFESVPLAEGDGPSSSATGHEGTSGATGAAGSPSPTTPLTPPPPLQPLTGTPPAGLSRGGSDGLLGFATPQSSLIALTQLAAFGGKGGIDEPTSIVVEAAGGGDDHLPPQAYANFSFFPAVDHHSGTINGIYEDRAAGTHHGRSSGPQQPREASSPCSSSIVGGSSAFTDALLLSDRTQHPPSAYQKGLRELANLVDASRGAAGRTTTSDSTEGFLLSGDIMFGTRATSSEVVDTLLGGSRTAPAPLDASTTTTPNVSTRAGTGGGAGGPQHRAMVPDGELIHFILHSALRQLVIARAFDLVPWIVRLVAAWEFCDPNTRTTMCLNFLQSCLPLEDPNKISVVLHSWAHVVRLDIASHAIYHDAAASWLHACLEWLFLDAQVSHRVSALCILSLLIHQGFRCAHLIELRRSELLEAIWNVLTDMHAWVRELAASTLQTLLVALLDRSMTRDILAAHGGAAPDEGGGGEHDHFGAPHHFSVVTSDGEEAESYRFNADDGSEDILLSSPSPFPLPSGLFGLNTGTSKRLSDGDADVRALVQRALHAFMSPATSTAAAPAGRQHPRVPSLSGGALSEDVAGRAGPMSDNGSFADSFSLASPSAASAANSAASPVSVSSAASPPPQQPNVVHAGALVLGALLGADRQIRVKHRRRSMPSAAPPRDHAPGGSADVTDEPSEVDAFGSSEHHPDGSGHHPSALFLPPANDEGGGANAGHLSLSPNMHAHSNSGSHINRVGLTPPDLSPASIYLARFSSVASGGDLRHGSTTIIQPQGPHYPFPSSNGSSAAHSPVPPITGGVWSAPPGSPESIEPLGGWQRTTGTAQRASAAMAPDGVCPLGPASFFLSTADINHIMFAIVAHKKKGAFRMHGCRLLPLLALYSSSLFLSNGDSALREIVGFAQMLKEMAVSGTTTLDKLQEDRSIVLTSIGLLYRALSPALPPFYYQVLMHDILPLLEDYLSAAPFSVAPPGGGGGASRFRVDAAATSLSLLMGSLHEHHRIQCEERVRSLCSIALSASHLSVETAGATAELVHYFPSLRRHAHTGLLRLVTDSLRRTFALPISVQQQQQQQQQMSDKSQRRKFDVHVARHVTPFVDDLLLPLAVTNRLTAFYVLRNLSLAMSWSGAAMYFLEVCAPYLHHPDPRVRRGCIACCAPMLRVDCTSSATEGEDEAFASWGGASMAAGSQGILEPSLWLCRQDEPDDALVRSSSLAVNHMDQAGGPPHHGRSHIAVLHRVVGKLMDVAVADHLPELRRAALSLFIGTTSYDSMIVCHRTALDNIFQIMNDPCAQNRHLALSVVARITRLVPSIASPRLHAFLVNLLEDLSCLSGGRDSAAATSGAEGPIFGGAIHRRPRTKATATAFSTAAVFASAVEERLLFLFQLLHSIPRSAVIPMYLPMLLQILQSVLGGADALVSPTAMTTALSMTLFLLEEAPDSSWGMFMPFYALAVRHVDAHHQGRMLSALNLLQALVKCVTAVHSSSKSTISEGVLDDSPRGDLHESPLTSSPTVAVGRHSGGKNNVRRSSTALLLADHDSPSTPAEERWMVTEAQLHSTANVLHGWMRQQTILLSASASIAIMRLLGALTAVEPLPTQPFVPVMESGLDGVDSRRRADAAVGLEDSRIVSDGARGWPFEILHYLLSVLAGNVVPLGEEDQRLTIAAVLRIFHSTPSVARHFHAFIGPFFRLLEQLLVQARGKAYVGDAECEAGGSDTTTTTRMMAGSGEPSAGTTSTAMYVSLLETVFSAIAQLLMSPDVSRSTYTHAATIVRLARVHWDAQRPSLLSRLCDVLSALNRQATEPLQEYVAWFISSLLSALVQYCPQITKLELTIKILMSIESFRGASSSNTLLLVVPTLCQILNTNGIPPDAKRHVGKALVRFIFSCNADPYIARVVECCVFQLELSEKAFQVERARVQKSISDVYNMRDSKKRSILEADLGQMLSDASLIAFSAVRTSSLPRILINYNHIGHKEVKTFPSPPHPPTSEADVKRLVADIVGQRMEVPAWLHPWEAEIVAVVCAAAGRCKSFDEYHASMTNRLAARFGPRSDVVRFFNSCANPSSHATLQRPIAVVTNSAPSAIQLYLQHMQDGDDSVTEQSVGTSLLPISTVSVARQRSILESGSPSGGAAVTTPQNAVGATQHLLPPMPVPGRGDGYRGPVHRKQSSLSGLGGMAGFDRSFGSPTGGSTTPLDFEPDPMFLRTPLMSGQLPPSAVKNPALFYRYAPPGGTAMGDTPHSSVPGSPEKGMSRQPTQPMPSDSYCTTPVAASPDGAAGRFEQRSECIRVVQRHDSSSLELPASPVHFQGGQRNLNPNNTTATVGGNNYLHAAAVNGSGSTSALLLSPSKLRYRPDANALQFENDAVTHPELAAEDAPSRQRAPNQREDLQNLFDQHKVNRTAAAHKTWFEQLVARLIQRSRHVYISACDELARRHYTIACAVFPFAFMSYLTTCEPFEREEWLLSIGAFEKSHRSDRSAQRIPLEIMREFSRLAYGIRRDAAVMFPDNPAHAAGCLPNDTVVRLAQRALQIPIAVSYLEEDVLRYGQWDKAPTLLELYDHASMRQEVHALRLQPMFHAFLQRNPHVITPELLETLGDVEAAIQLYDQRPHAQHVPLVDVGRGSGANIRAGMPRAVTAFHRQARQQRTPNALRPHGSAASLPQSPSLLPTMTSPVAHSPGNIDYTTTLHPLPTFPRRATHHHHHPSRWHQRSREDQVASSAAAVLRCLNHTFNFRRTIAYFHTMQESDMYSGLVGSGLAAGGAPASARTRHRSGASHQIMHPEIARQVALAAHCMGDWELIREVCTASGVKRGASSAIQRYGSMCSENGVPYATKHHVSKELLLYSAASDVARGYCDEALETMERLRELLMDAATVLHAESSKRRMDLNMMIVSMTDLEEAIHVLRKDPAANRHHHGSSVVDAASLSGDVIPHRLLTIGHRSLPAQASSLHLMQAVSFRAAFVPRSKQLRNLFVLCEQLASEGQQQKAQEVLRDALRLTTDAESLVASRPSRSNSFAAMAGHHHHGGSYFPYTAVACFDPSQFEHQAIVLESLKIGLETAGCRSRPLERLQADVQHALRTVANYVDESTIGGFLVSPLSTYEGAEVNPSITQPLSEPSTADGGAVTNMSGGGGPQLFHGSYARRSSGGTVDHQPAVATAVGAAPAKGTLELRVELETLDVEITRRLTGFFQFPTTRRGGRPAPCPSYVVPAAAQQLDGRGLWKLTAALDDRDLKVFMSSLFHRSEDILSEHHSVTDANFATSLKEFSLLYFDVCKMLRSEWVEVTTNGGEERLQILQRFRTASSECVTALQRAAAMCVKAFDLAATPATHHAALHQPPPTTAAPSGSGGAVTSDASSPMSAVQQPPAGPQRAAPHASGPSGAASGLAVNTSGAGQLAYASRRRVASARANITVSDLLLKALNTAWNGNCMHDLNLAPDMLPSWALVSPFLAHYASRSTSIQQIVTQMCQQSLGMLSQMSFYLVSSFETVGLRTIAEEQLEGGNSSHGGGSAAGSPHANEAAQPPSPLSRTTSNVTAAATRVRSRSVLQMEGGPMRATSQGALRGDAGSPTSNTITSKASNEDLLDLPLELAPPPVMPVPPHVHHGQQQAGGVASSETNPPQPPPTFQLGGTLFSPPPAALTSPDALQPTDVTSKVSGPVYEALLGSSLVGAAQVHHQQLLPTTVSSAKRARHRLLATLAPHVSMRTWWELQQQALAIESNAREALARHSRRPSRSVGGVQRGPPHRSQAHGTSATPAEGHSQLIQWYGQDDTAQLALVVSDLDVLAEVSLNGPLPGQPASVQSFGVASGPSHAIAVAVGEEGGASSRPPLLHDARERLGDGLPVVRQRTASIVGVKSAAPTTPQPAIRPSSQQRHQAASLLTPLPLQSHGISPQHAGVLPPSQPGVRAPSVLSPQPSPLAEGSPNSPLADGFQTRRRSAPSYLRPSVDNNVNNNNNQLASSNTSSLLPALHHKIVLDIAKTSPQHRSLLHATLRFARWMGSGDGESAIDLLVEGHQASSTGGPAMHAATSWIGGGLRGCPLPLPTWHVHQQCAKPIASRATMLSARRVVVPNAAPPFATEELVWLVLSDGTTLKFHHGLTPALHGAQSTPAPTANDTGGDAHGQRTKPTLGRIQSNASVTDLAQWIHPPLAPSTAAHQHPAGKKKRRGGGGGVRDQAQPSAQRSVHVPLCTCHPPRDSWCGNDDSSDSECPQPPSAAFPPQMPAFDGKGWSLSSPGLEVTKEADDGRHESLSAAATTPPYATMSATFSNVIEHLPLHHMRRSLVIPFSAVNALTQIMTSAPITTRSTAGAAGRSNGGAAAGRPKYLPLRHVAMTSLYHLMDAYSVHRARDELDPTTSGGMCDSSGLMMVLPSAPSLLTKKQRAYQHRVADFYDSGGVVHKGELEGGIEATLEDLRNVFDATPPAAAAAELPSPFRGGDVLAGQAGEDSTALAARLNVLRKYREKPQEYLRQLMILEAHDPSQWIASRTVFSKQLAEWSMLQYLFDISCRCPAYFVVDLASGHITQLELGLHALPAAPAAAQTSSGLNFSSPLDLQLFPNEPNGLPHTSSSNASSGPCSSGTQDPPMPHHRHPLSALSPVASNLATRDPCTFRMTTAMQHALPMRSPYSGFLLYASEGLRQMHLVKKELIGLLEYGLEGVRVRSHRHHRNSRRDIFVSNRRNGSGDSTPDSELSVDSHTTGGGGANDASGVIGSAATQQRAADHRESLESSRQANVPGRRDTDGDALLEMMNASFAESDTASRALHDDWAPTTAPALEADEEGFDGACFDVSTAIVRLNENLSVASCTYTKQHYDLHRGVVVRSTPSPAPSHNRRGAEEELWRAPPNHHHYGASMTTGSGGGEVTEHPLTKPLDSFEDFVGCIHSQAATKIQRFVRSGQRLRRLRRRQRAAEEGRPLVPEEPACCPPPPPTINNHSLSSSDAGTNRGNGSSPNVGAALYKSPALTFKAHLGSPERLNSVPTAEPHVDPPTSVGSTCQEHEAAPAAGDDDGDDGLSPRSAHLVPGVTFRTAKTYQHRVESLIEAALDEGNIAGRGWDVGQPHPWLVWCPYW